MAQQQSSSAGKKTKAASPPDNLDNTNSELRDEGTTGDTPPHLKQEDGEEHSANLERTSAKGHGDGRQPLANLAIPQALDISQLMQRYTKAKRRKKKEETEAEEYWKLRAEAAEAREAAARAQWAAARAREAAAIAREAAANARMAAATARYQQIIGHTYTPSQQSFPTSQVEMTEWEIADELYNNY